MECLPLAVRVADGSGGGPVVVHGGGIVEDPRHVQHKLLVRQLHQPSFHLCPELRAQGQSAHTFVRLFFMKIKTYPKTFTQIFIILATIFMKRKFCWTSDNNPQ